MRPRLTRPATLDVALGNRLFGPTLLAFIVVVEERAFGTDDLGAALALGPESVFADQRAYP